MLETAASTSFVDASPNERPVFSLSVGGVGRAWAWLTNNRIITLLYESAPSSSPCFFFFRTKQVGIKKFRSVIQLLFPQFSWARFVNKRCLMRSYFKSFHKMDDSIFEHFTFKNIDFSFSEFDSFFFFGGSILGSHAPGLPRTMRNKVIVPSW